MTSSDLPLPKRQAGIAQERRSAKRTVITASIFVAMLAIIAAWWWLLATGARWLVLSVIDVIA